MNPLDASVRWKVISGYSDYHVSDDGRVFSDKSNILLKAATDKKGYRIVVLWREKKGNTRRVGRLVGKAFVANPLNLPQIDHIDRNRQNDNATNLRWADAVTQTQNQAKHKTRNGQSIYKCVSWTGYIGRPWRVQVHADGVIRVDKGFAKESEARVAADIAILEYHKSPLTNEMLYGKEQLAKWDEEEANDLDRDKHRPKARKYKKRPKTKEEKSAINHKQNEDRKQVQIVLKDIKDALGVDTTGKRIKILRALNEWFKINEIRKEEKHLFSSVRQALGLNAGANQLKILQLALAKIKESSS
jgi:hypothetical protein